MSLNEESGSCDGEGEIRLYFRFDWRDHVRKKVWKLLKLGLISGYEDKKTRCSEQSISFPNWSELLIHDLLHA